MTFIFSDVFEFDRYVCVCARAHALFVFYVSVGTLFGNALFLQSYFLLNIMINNSRVSSAKKTMTICFRLYLITIVKTSFSFFHNSFHENKNFILLYNPFFML